MSIEAMKQALAYIEEVDYGPYDSRPIVSALRAAIEQAEKQEPVAWMYEWGGRKHLTFTDQRFVEQAHPHFNKSTPLYAAPRQWVGLTDEEIAREFYKFEAAGAWYQFARAIEAKLKEKNT